MNIVSFFKKWAYLREEKGAAALEFAIVSGAFILLLSGVCATGLYFFALNRLQFATENAARHASIHENYTEADLEEIIAEGLSGVPYNPANLSVEFENSTLNGVNFVHIRSSLLMQVGLPLLPEAYNAIDLKADIRMSAY